MPEAAEVTVAAVQLDALVSGRTLQALTVTHPRASRAQDPAALAGAFVGRELVAVRRVGKWLVCDFAGVDVRLGIHLRMSGQLLVDPLLDRHCHGLFDFGPGTSSSPVGVPSPPGPVGTGPVRVVFRDPRTFGELRLFDTDPGVAVDVLDVSPEQMAAAAARRSRLSTKALLCDQRAACSGVGSYLADESCFVAGVDPCRRAASLDVLEWGHVLTAARTLVAASAALGGVSLADETWVDLWGRTGQGAQLLRVHARSTCGVCGTATVRGVTGGRSVRWCPSCQL